MATFISVGVDSNGEHKTMFIADDKLKHYNKASWLKRWIQVADSIDVPDVNVDKEQVFTTEKKKAKKEIIKEEAMIKSDDINVGSDIDEEDSEKNNAIIVNFGDQEMIVPVPEIHDIEEHNQLEPDTIEPQEITIPIGKKPRKPRKKKE